MSAIQPAMQMLSSSAVATAVDLPWSTIEEWAGAILILIGVLLTLIAAIGLIRFKDAYSRMHAASKPQMLGLFFVCAGITLEQQQWRWLIISLVVIVLQFISAPVGTILLGRAVHRTDSAGNVDLVVDELETDLQDSSSFE